MGSVGLLGCQRRVAIGPKKTRRAGRQQTADSRQQTDKAERHDWRAGTSRQIVGPGTGQHHPRLAGGWQFALDAQANVAVFAWCERLAHQVVRCLCIDSVDDEEFWDSGPPKSTKLCPLYGYQWTPSPPVDRLGNVRADLVPLTAARRQGARLLAVVHGRHWVLAVGSGAEESAVQGTRAQRVPRSDRSSRSRLHRSHLTGLAQLPPCSPHHHLGCRGRRITTK